MHNKRIKVETRDARGNWQTVADFNTSPSLVKHVYRHGLDHDINGATRITIDEPSGGGPDRMTEEEVRGMLMANW